MVERIAQRMRHRRGPSLEFLKRFGWAGAVALGHPVGAHGTPLVMIPFKPDFEKIVELPVLGNIPRREVAVIIEDRLWCGKLAIKTLGRPRVQEEVVSDEFHYDP